MTVSVALDSAGRRRDLWPERSRVWQMPPHVKVSLYPKTEGPALAAARPPEEDARAPRASVARGQRDMAPSHPMPGRCAPRCLCDGKGNVK